MTIDELSRLANERLKRHPVLEAMTSCIEVEASLGSGGMLLRYVFDGPALPQKQARELTFDGALLAGALDEWLVAIEHDIAAVIKKAGLGGT